MTAQWLLRPLSFGSLPAFLPHWSAEELVTTYAIVGGVPAYLEWLQPERGLVGSLRDVILAPGSMFLSEPTLILSNEIRDPRVHRTIVQAIGRGAHTLNEISAASFVSKTHLPAYLQRLQELRLVERRLPATVPVVAGHDDEVEGAASARRLRRTARPPRPRHEAGGRQGGSPRRSTAPPGRSPRRSEQPPEAPASSARPCPSRSSWPHDSTQAQNHTSGCWSRPGGAVCYTLAACPSSSRRASRSVKDCRGPKGRCSHCSRHCSRDRRRPKKQPPRHFGEEAVCRFAMRLLWRGGRDSNSR